MIRNTFNYGWAVTQDVDFSRFKKLTKEPVMLPYDDMIWRQRTKDASSQSHTGYFPDTTCALVKNFNVPIEWEGKHIIFEFESVYTNSMIYINGDYAGGCPHGYTNFYIQADSLLRYGQENEIKVLARTYKDSRWYTGIGLYRGVNIMIGGAVYIQPDSYRITTLEADDEIAAVEIACTLLNRGAKNINTRVETQLLYEDKSIAAECCSAVTAFPFKEVILRQRLYTQSPLRWEPDNPYLYLAKTKVYDGDELIDEEVSTFGIRTLSLDVHRGLRVNGKEIKLRGACVHHDNGVIGAAAIGRAEERRVELLKKAGFNAVRSAHNPISKAFINACDKHGLLVMDELSDVWTRCKRDYDFSSAFPFHWEQATEMMVKKNYNHPSVIIYSIGNEIPETGTPHGAAIGRKLAEKIRTLDNTRYITNCISFVITVINRIGNRDELEQGGGLPEINEFINNFSAVQDKIVLSELASSCTAESFDAVDISGYNYADLRYVSDKKMFPNRVICGSETFANQIGNNWKIVKENAHVIGDFTWTGWDYLGEAGIGKMEYVENGTIPGFYGAHPWYIAYCGDIDIIGCRRPASFYREIVFGLRKEPYIAVRYPWNYGKTLIPSKWSFIDGVSSWTWTGYEGKPVEIEVYADADRVELLLNGVKAGEADIVDCKAVITATYQAGELEAVAYSNGIEMGRSVLTTAESALQLSVDVDRSEIRADDTDLAYIMISLTDEKGVINNMADRTVTVTVEGEGFLLGLGSANPKSEESFRQNSCATFNGMALAVIRPLGIGIIDVLIEADACESKRICLNAR